MAICGLLFFVSKHSDDSSLQVEDVSKWSPRMREPMEAVYGVEGFPKLWFETKKLKEP